MGISVVSVDVPAAVDFADHVQIAGDYASFLQKLDKALGEGQTKASIKARQQCVASIGWESRSENLLQVIHRAMPALQSKLERR